MGDGVKILQFGGFLTGSWGEERRALEATPVRTVSRDAMAERQRHWHSKERTSFLVYLHIGRTLIPPPSSVTDAGVLRSRASNLCKNKFRYARAPCSPSSTSPLLPSSFASFCNSSKREHRRAFSIELSRRDSMISTWFVFTCYFRG